MIVTREKDTTTKKKKIDMQTREILFFFSELK